MKRTLLLFSALMLSYIALWAQDVVKDGIYYNLNKSNKTAHVTYEGDKYNSSSYKYGINIPETITYILDTYTVTSISASAFYLCDDLTSVTIPNTVTSIGYDAFSGCSGLTSVTIPNSVTFIGSRAFSGCSGLTSVTIPNSVTSIGESAFFGCSGLTSVIWNIKNYEEDFKYDSYYGTYISPFFYIRSKIISFTFGNEVEHIPAYLCVGMNNLKEVTIPNSVTSIGAEAFSGCSGLTSVTIGESVTSIGTSVFRGCSSLTSVTIPTSVTSIGDKAFNGCI